MESRVADAIEDRGDGGRLSRLLPWPALAWVSVSQWLLLLALALSVPLRLIGLSRQSLWTDELYVVWEGRQPLDLIFNPLIHYQHPPGYRLALHLWMGVSHAESWIRLLPALAGIALIPVIWGIARTLWPGRSVAAGEAALLVATSPFLLHYSQDATSYSWIVLWTALSALALLYAWRSDRRWLWTAWALTLTVALYSHYFSIFPVGAEIAMLVFVAIGAMKGRAREARQETKKRLVHAGVALLAALVVYIPWLLVLVSYRDHIQTTLFPLYWDGYATVWIPKLLVGLEHARVWESVPGLIAVWALFAAGAALLAWRLTHASLKGALRTPANYAALGLLMWIIFSVAGPYIAERITTPSPDTADWSRFAAFAAPAILLGVAGIVALLRPALRVIALCGWLLFAGVQWDAEVTSLPAQDWRGLLSTVATQAQPKDALLAFTAFHAGAAAAYYPVPMPVQGGWFTPEGSDPEGAAYWFPTGWQFRGYLDVVTTRTADWETEIKARSAGAGHIWYLAGDGIGGTYLPGPAFEKALASLGWHFVQEWHRTPLVLKLYSR